MGTLVRVGRVLQVTYRNLQRSKFEYDVSENRLRGVWAGMLADATASDQTVLFHMTRLLTRFSIEADKTFRCFLKNTKELFSTTIRSAVHLEEFSERVVNLIDRFTIFNHSRGCRNSSSQKPSGTA